ncbi:hypothetical protein BD289DRAFT_142076 [Coniella lustricola]|uniref:Uncharacterized protein n=1 Tax=Coniella lustricola TaxID=2025994 RepID=A0A2T2ZVC1_9PEZI|nr:hypothetical protein BD289DRAFT_142076 [Coniella lustricola]
MTPASKKQKTQQYTAEEITNISSQQHGITETRPSSRRTQSVPQTARRLHSRRPPIIQSPQAVFQSLPQPPPAPATDGIGPIRGDPKLYPPSVALTEHQLRRIIAWSSERRRDEDLRLGRTLDRRPPPLPGYYYFVRNTTTERPTSPPLYYHKTSRGATATARTSTKQRPSSASSIQKKSKLLPSSRQHNDLVSKLDTATALLMMNATDDATMITAASSKSKSLSSSPVSSESSRGQKKKPPAPLAVPEIQSSLAQKTRAEMEAKSNAIPQIKEKGKCCMMV